MIRTFLVILTLALASLAMAQEPNAITVLSQPPANVGAAVATDTSSGTASKLEFPGRLVAAWQDDPPDAAPARPRSLPALPARRVAQTEPAGNVPPLPVPLPNPAGAGVPGNSSPLGAAAGTLVPTPEASGAPYSIIDSNREAEMHIFKGRSRLLRSSVEFARTAVVDPNICDLIQYSPTDLGFVGKAVGTTQVTVWFRDSDNPNVDTQPRSFIVHVDPDDKDVLPRLKQLEAEIAKLFPNSKVRLRTFGQRILVLGQARNVEEAARILDIIRGEAIDANGKWVSGPQGYTQYNAQGDAGAGGAGAGGAGAGGAGGGSNFRGRQNRRNNAYYDDVADAVINMLKVPGVHQVMLRVKIAELDRTAARNFGANFSANIQFNNGTLLLQSLLNASNANSILGNFNNNQLSFGISYLEQHGVIRLLSEPTVVTLSGKPVNFVAGGEFAVPTVVGIGGAAAQTTDFRAYGAIVSCTPYLLDKDMLRLDISPEFSQIGGQTVNGVPGLTTRTVTTTVELHAGQTLAIAGLLDESMKSSTESDWPLIGKLIGPRSVSRAETELLILVTPELVHPMEPEEVPPLPGFDVTEPDNIEFFFRGDIEGNPTRDYRSTVWPILQQRYRAGGTPMISGPFGHSNEWAGDGAGSNCKN